MRSAIRVIVQTSLLKQTGEIVTVTLEWCHAR
jgi:hypothetical protein